MTPYEMGRISAFLLKYRKIEHRTNKRGLQKEERDFAELLRDAPMDALGDLSELLNGYGFELITMTTFDVAGVGSGERVYLLARKPNVECPLLDLTRAVERMEPISGRAKVGKIWLTQFWLIHLDIIYTQRDRGADERNQWIEATFTKDLLIQSMRDYINGSVRRLNAEEIIDNDVYETLTSEKGLDIARYATKFLELMVDGGLLDDKGNGVYRQTLLSAVEMKENYGRILEPLMLQEQGTGIKPEFSGLSSALLMASERMEGEA